jgi:hypothetical protein
MRLDFNVLWVEDQPTYVQAQHRTISRHMEDNGFAFNAVHCQTIDDVRAQLQPDVFNDEIDLVLVDWDLGTDATGAEIRGQTVIEEIRTEIPYKDIIFYSAQTSPDQLRNFAHDARLDGIFFTPRTNLVQEVKDVFDSIVRKILDLDHTRGIVMGATSDIDHMVNECLKHAHGMLDDDGKKTVIAEAMVHIDERMKKMSQLVDGLRTATALEPLFEHHAILTAYDRLRMLAGVLNLDRLVAHKSHRKSVTSYMQNVVPDRNIFGHQIAEPGNPKKILDNKGQPIDLDRAREIRRNILGLRGDFRILLEALLPPAAT